MDLIGVEAAVFDDPGERKGMSMHALWAGRRFGATLTVLAVALALVACGGSGDNSDGGSSDAKGQKRSVTMVFPVPLGLFWSGFIVAQERYYPEMGLEVEFASVDGSSGVVQQVATGNAFAGVSAFPEVYAAQEQGADVISIAVLGQGRPVNANLSVPAESPIDSLTDLRDKAIGVPSASDGSIPIVKKLMSEAGVDEGEYDLPVVGAGGPAAAAALESDRIGAYAHGLSDVAALRVKGDITLRSLMPEKYGELPSDGVVVQKSTMDDAEDREVAIKLARGYIQGAQFVATNRDEAQTIICDAVPRECQDEALVEALLDVVAEHYRPAGGGRSGFHNPEQIDVLLGLLLGGEQPIPLEEVFVNEYIPRINKGLDTPESADQGAAGS